MLQVTTSAAVDGAQQIPPVYGINFLTKPTQPIPPLPSGIITAPLSFDSPNTVTNTKWPFPFCYFWITKTLFCSRNDLNAFWSTGSVANSNSMSRHHRAVSNPIVTWLKRFFPRSIIHNSVAYLTISYDFDSTWKKRFSPWLNEQMYEGITERERESHFHFWLFNQKNGHENFRN